MTKLSFDNQHQSSSSEVKYAERSSGSRVAEHKEVSSSSTSSHGAGIAMLLDTSGRKPQQQQRRHQMAGAGGSSLHERLAELHQSLSNSIDAQPASTVNTDLAALLNVLTAAVTRPTE